MFLSQKKTQEGYGYSYVDTCTENIKTLTQDNLLGAEVAQSVYSLGCGLMSRVQFLTGTMMESFLFAPHPDKIWGPPSLFPMGTRRSYVSGKVARAQS
jgi:hypothetical protein